MYVKFTSLFHIWKKLWNFPEFLIVWKTSLICIVSMMFWIFSNIVKNWKKHCNVKKIEHRPPLPAEEEDRPQHFLSLNSFLHSFWVPLLDKSLSSDKKLKSWALILRLTTDLRPSQTELVWKSQTLYFYRSEKKLHGVAFQKNQWG